MHILDKLKAPAARTVSSVLLLLQALLGLPFLLTIVGSVRLWMHPKGPK